MKTSMNVLYSGVLWRQAHPRATFEHLGYIPKFLSAFDPRSVRDQFDANYIGRWRPRHSAGMFTVERNTLLYPGDPPCHELYFALYRDEVITIYEHAMVMIANKDGYEIARMD